MLVVASKFGESARVTRWESLFGAHIRYFEKAILESKINKLSKHYSEVILHPRMKQVLHAIRYEVRLWQICCAKDYSESKRHTPNTPKSCDCKGFLSAAVPVMLDLQICRSWREQYSPWYSLHIRDRLEFYFHIFC